MGHPAFVAGDGKATAKATAEEEADSCGNDKQKGKGTGKGGAVNCGGPPFPKSEMLHLDLESAHPAVSASSESTISEPFP